MAGVVGATAPWVFLPLGTRTPPPVAAGVRIPSLLPGWVGESGTGGGPAVCSAGESTANCLATPYGTVMTGPLAAGARSAPGATIWIRPLQAGQWRPDAEPIPLAHIGQAGAPAPRVSLVGATGPWVVADVYGPGRTVSVDAVNLSGGRVMTLTSLSSPDLGTVAVGSDRTLVDDGSVLEVYKLPATATGAPVLTLLPESERIQAMQSLAQGFLAPDVVLPGLAPAAATLDASNPLSARLKPYAVGSWTLPLRAPRGWVVVPPHEAGAVTSVALVNPKHPGQWVAIRTDPALSLTEALDGRGRAVAIGLPGGAGARVVWITDRTVAFSVPSGRTVVNGVLYPNALGGVVELEVALPKNEKPLATAILDSAHLPY